MIYKVKDDKTVEIIKHRKTEEYFLALNENMGYLQINNPSYSRYNKYKIKNGKVVVDVEANNIIFKKEILDKLEIQIDTHSLEAKKFILGDKYCKLNIYEHKEVRANKGKFSASKNKAILDKANELHTKENNFIDLIEAYTDVILDYVENKELDKAERCLNIASEYDNTTTLEDINKLKNA